MFANHDAIIASLTAGKKCRLFWQKTTTSAHLGWYHLWPVAGQPESGSYSGANLQWQGSDDSTTGALGHGGDVSPSTKHLIYASNLAFFLTSSAGAIMFVDQVGYYPLTQDRASQAFDNANNGAPGRYCSAGQCGLQMMLVATSDGGSTASNISTVTYVNQDGVLGRVAPSNPAISLLASVPAPSGTQGAQVVTGGQPNITNAATALPFIPLQPGDMGVRSVTNIAFSAANTGNLAMVLCKPLCCVPIPPYSDAALYDRDLVMAVASLERIYDGACISMLAYFPSSISSTSFYGELDAAWS